jgi:hypothetical protein
LAYISGFSQQLNAETIGCKKFDIKCKANKFISDTKDFQKKGIDDGKEQLKGTKKKLKEAIPKKK